MPSVKWRHNSKSLLLPIVVFPGYTSNNPSESIRVEGLLDTGSTGTGLRRDLVERLSLRPKGQRRVNTANGLLFSAEYIVRLGFLIGDYDDPAFSMDTRQPYVLDQELIGFELQAGFTHAVLIGMDVIGAGDLVIQRDGSAELRID